MQRSKKFGLAAAALVSLMVASQAHAATNLIGDGDFATPATGNGYIFAANGTVGGWTNQSEGVIEVGNSGIYSLPCFNASCSNLEVNANGYDTVTQKVSGLTVGKTYLLTYAYGDRVGYDQALDVSFGGYNQSITGSGGGWTVYTTRIVATETSEILSFAAQAVGTNAAWGNEITGVSLTAVPEPASWAMMILGLGGIGFVLRRRNAQASALA